MEIEDEVVPMREAMKKVIDSGETTTEKGNARNAKRKKMFKEKVGELEFLYPCRKEKDCC